MTAAATCPRCLRAFGCGADAGTPCDCTTIALSAALQARLRVSHLGCLCMTCLRELAAQDAAAPQAAPPAPPAALR